MIVLANLPALLLALNLAGPPGDEQPRGSSMEPAPREHKEVGFARMHLKRDIRFATTDTQASDTLNQLEAAGRPASASGLPHRIEARGSGVRHLEVCESLHCRRR